MRKIVVLAVLGLLAPLLGVVVTASSASATPDCIFLSEFQQVNNGQTREHVHFDIFDGYIGGNLDTGPGGDGFIYQLRTYAHCGNPSTKAQINYKKPVGDPDTSYKVISGRCWNPCKR